MAMMRVALLTLACASSALAGSISLRGAVTAVAETAPRREEDPKSEKKEGKADPCEMSLAENVTHSAQQGQALRNATREAARNGTTHEPRRAKGEVLTLYHQTSAEIAALIWEGGFKPGTRGWCGGGIYFAVKPWETYKKAIGPNSHLGFIIEAQVDLGRVRHMSPTCDRSMTAEKMFRDGYDSVRFNPGDGDEIVVYSPDSILSMKHFAWS